mmetsp:Transcript_7000/g.10274  ORF Transcript_7000/g.10274 Transcript_7000/m.10274 type:complete len:372 (+) Transcript_7000:84-1199(+)
MYHSTLAKDIMMEGEDGEPMRSTSKNTNPQINKYTAQSNENLTNKQLVAPLIDLLKSNSNFEAMPGSSKVIVFDLDIRVQDAFEVAKENDISFACLWDNASGKLVGMLTVTDLIAILLHYKDETSKIKDLFMNHTVRKWRELSERERKENLISIHPEQSLWDSVMVLKKNKIHRLPIISEENLLHVATHAHLLSYLCSQRIEEHPIFNKTLESLGIGTYESVYKVTKKVSVHEVMKIFSEKNISAIPVVDENDVFEDVYSRYDVVYLVRDDSDDFLLNASLEDALKTRPKKTAYICNKNETFGAVVNHLAHSRIHRLVVVDENRKLLGILSISDIFSFFVQHDEEDSSDEDVEDVGEDDDLFKDQTDVMLQ